MSSFKNKPLMTLDWSLKSRKHFHRYFSNCDQGKRIRRIYSFIKEYYHKDCTPQFINFNKKFSFVLFFLLLCLHCRTFVKFVRTTTLKLMSSSKLLDSLKTSFFWFFINYTYHEGNEINTLTTSIWFISTCLIIFRFTPCGLHELFILFP